jgi:Uma2 family endonuclease
MAATARKFETLDAFLRWERRQEFRHEWEAGVITAMTGTRVAHNKVVRNIARLLDTVPALRDCHVFTESIKVRIGNEALYYPDIVVTCANIDDDTDIAPNPIIIVEVLSDSTASADRGRKWLRYQTLRSLRHYVIIWQSTARIEVYDPDGTTWRHRTIRGRAASLTLDGIGATLKLDDVYARTEIGLKRSRSTRA